MKHKKFGLTSLLAVCLGLIFAILFGVFSPVDAKVAPKLPPTPTPSPTNGHCMLLEEGEICYIVFPDGCMIGDAEIYGPESEGVPLGCGTEVAGEDLPDVAPGDAHCMLLEGGAICYIVHPSGCSTTPEIYGPQSAGMRLECGRAKE